MSLKASLFQESNWWINPFLFSAVFCETEDHTHQTIQLLNLSSQALGSAISFLFSSQSSSNQCLHRSHLNQKTAPGYNSKYWFFPGKWASNLHIWTHSPQIYIIIHDREQFIKCVELPPFCLCSGFPQLCSSLVSHQLANSMVYSRDSVVVLDPTLPVTSIIISPRAFQLANLSLCNRKPQNPHYNKDSYSKAEERTFICWIWRCKAVTSPEASSFTIAWKQKTFKADVCERPATADVAW